MLAKLNNIVGNDNSCDIISYFIPFAVLLACLTLATVIYNEKPTLMIMIEYYSNLSIIVALNISLISLACSYNKNLAQIIGSGLMLSWIVILYLAIKDKGYIAKN